MPDAPICDVVDLTVERVRPALVDRVRNLRNSGYDLGPEIASQARLFDGKLWWDSTYLDTDMNEQTAQEVLNQVQQILQQAAEIKIQPA